MKDISKQVVILVAAMGLGAVAAPAFAGGPDDLDVTIGVVDQNESVENGATNEIDVPDGDLDEVGEHNNDVGDGNNDNHDDGDANDDVADANDNAEDAHDQAADTQGNAEHDGGN